MEQANIKVSSLPSKQFYFLDYFFIMLSSVDKNSIQDEAFNTFKVLKQEYRLGESKYKKLERVENPTKDQQKRYRYTFNKVKDECREYGLLTETKDETIYLTDKGENLLYKHINDSKEGIPAFNISIFKLIEDAHGYFRTLIELLYQANDSGVLLFPHYSPLELGFNRKDIQTTGDIWSYIESLVKRLQKDILKYQKPKGDMVEQSRLLLEKIVKDGLLPEKLTERFKSKDYNKITKRIRDYWITYFLKELYNCPFSMTSFDIWVYRAKQIGIIQVTESYPHIIGKLVYPTSVVIENVQSKDFSNMYQYPDGKCLFVHNPALGHDGETYKENFIKALVKGYFELKRQVRYNFINLVSLREIVCFRMKISSFTFEKSLDEIYKLNLSGTLNISISLEVDKLPEETNAMYMKHEPVMVDGSYRNIISIDVTKGGFK